MEAYLINIPTYRVYQNNYDLKMRHNRGKYRNVTVISYLAKEFSCITYFICKKALLLVNTDSNKVMCTNFEHSALNSSFTKSIFLQMKNSLATIVNGLPVFSDFEY